ncbi:hypothetical protein IQ268_04285 [Oculatella sp. LEGE 06141]|uniref:hypothetical protein n=1 Tax=Oculatella sp. LEGE 06141 TaxID=1828648 RepID=UPI00187EA369|nr:hypothetical protein [Oculatella sp. LEGE 06141]MBE9177799.1 hypothetical protein [Oculatella sp. LEGE 06141]
MPKIQYVAVPFCGSWNTKATLVPVSFIASPTLSTTDWNLWAKYTSALLGVAE